MPGVIAGIAPQLGRTCLLSSITSIVRYLRPEAEISEAILLGVAAGLNFRYGHYEIRGTVHAKLPDITCFHICLDRERFSALLCRLGITLRERTHSCAADAAAAVKADVVQRHPVMVIVHDRQLEYLPEAVRARGEARFVICHGWDERAGMAWVTDQVIPSSARPLYQGPVPAERFTQALDLRQVVHDDTYVTWHFSATGMAGELTSADVAGSIQRSHQEMVSGGVGIYPFGTSRVMYRCGAEGIRSLSSDLNEAAGLQINNHISGWLKELYGLLVTHAGPVTARALFAEYLGWAREKGLTVRGRSMGEQVLRLSKEWATIANTLYKAAVNRDAACIERTAQRVARMADKEHAALRELCDCFEQGGQLLWN